MRKLSIVLVFLSIAASLPAQKKQTQRVPQVSKAAQHVPLTEREKALQLLNRFTFGPRPGDVDRVLAMTPEKWFEQQLDPQAINDDTLEKRLNEYPTLNLQPNQALAIFPDRGIIQQVAEGKRPYPGDPLLAATYEVQVYKFNRDVEQKKFAIEVDPSTGAKDAEVDAQKREDQATAARIAGDLFALPKNQRMAALVKLPVLERVAFTTYLAGDQRGLLLSQFTPTERELFNGMAANTGSSYQIVNELSQAKILRSILSERQLQEVMTDFWFNHFNIYIAKDSDQWYTTTYEREAIRRHSLGKFRDLLIATATSPAMMVYLDNWLSIGPNSAANGANPAKPNAKRGNRGLNENYGREVMELHTLGVNGGYTQADVTALSAVLTGWTVDHPNEGGPFLFDPKKHEPSPAQWRGVIFNPAPTPAATTYQASKQHDPGDSQSQMNEGIEALTILAADPHTARYISYELAQRFLADDPPPTLVEHLTQTYLSTDGDIKAILRTLVQSPEFNSKQYFRKKVKTPLEFVSSVFRATATDPVNPGAIVNTLKNMGMAPYYASPPTGYPITADHWMNSVALVDRLNFASTLTSNKFANQKFDSANLLALSLMSQSARTDTAKYTPAAASVTREPTVPADGVDIAIRSLKSILIGDRISPQTDELIHKQINQSPNAGATESLNLLTALLIGSPEFQLR
jgi:uncharacterized protein (DUF1800 family)